MLSGLRWGGGSVPAEGSGCGWGRGLAAGEEGHGFGAEDGAALVEHGVGKFCYILGGGEKAGLGSYSAEDEGIFVLDFALDYSLAEGAADGCGFRLAVVVAPAFRGRGRPRHIRQMVFRRRWAGFLRGVLLAD